jgi:hypothetical protein
MRKQHLDLLAIAAGLGKRFRLGECTSNIASFFIHIARHPTLWR